MTTEGLKSGAGFLGIGAAACAACCAGPILGILAAAGILTVAAYLALGLVGLAIAILVTLRIARRRRRSAGACASPSPGPQPVTFGARRAP